MNPDLRMTLFRAPIICSGSVVGPPHSPLSHLRNGRTGAQWPWTIGEHLLEWPWTIGMAMDNSLHKRFTGMLMLYQLVTSVCLNSEL